MALQGLGGKILQADVYAGVAGRNQQSYQATQQSAQWKTCNSRNIIVRREWWVIDISAAGFMLMSLGLPFLQLRKRITSRLSSAWRSFHRSSLSLSALDVRTGTMTLWLHIFAKLFLFTTLATSCPGIDTLPTLTRRLCGTSVATRDISLTTTGRNGLTTQQSLLYSMVRIPPWVATVFLDARTRRVTASRQTLPH